MGDSITEGWLNARPEFFAGRPFVDRGISGQTTPQMLVRFRQDVIALKPAVVHIMAGINDIAGNTGPTTQEAIRNNLRSMAELARANGIAVVLASVLPANQFPWRPGAKPGPEVVALNDWIRAYAAENGHVYVDYWAATHDGALGMKPEYAYDGVHPTAAGYAAMEPLALRAIEEAARLRR
jgi:lysophospholipase L1-like esterase